MSSTGTCGGDCVHADEEDVDEDDDGGEDKEEGEESDEDDEEEEEEEDTEDEEGVEDEDELDDALEEKFEEILLLEELEVFCSSGLHCIVVVLGLLEPFFACVCVCVRMCV